MKKIQGKLIFLMAIKFALIMHYVYYKQLVMTWLIKQGKASRESPFLNPLVVVAGYEQLG